MASRTGVPSLIGIASEMCRLLAKFSPIIAAKYPTNAALIAALAAANAACSVLDAELKQVRETGA